MSLSDFRWNNVSETLNIVVGPNGSGKTNLFRALHFALVESAPPFQGFSPAQYVYRKSLDQSFEVKLGLRFTSDEQELITAFVGAAFCDVEAIGQIPDGFPPGAASNLAEAMQGLKRPSIADVLFAGSLRVEWNNIDLLRSSFEFGPKGTWRFGIDSHDGLISNEAHIASAPIDLLSAWDRSLDEKNTREKQQRTLFHNVAAAKSTDQRILDPPDLAAILDVLDGPIRLSVRDSQTKSALHRRFFDLIGSPMNHGQQYGIGTVLRRIMAGAVLRTENDRSPPTSDFSSSWDQSPPDIASGENLARHLLRLKNGTTADMRDRYGKIQQHFNALTSRTAHVALGPGEPDGDGQTPQAIQIMVTDGDIEVPLEYSGSGATEALFVSSALAEPRAVVVLDEPSTSLHPVAQNQLSILIRERADAQVFVATHSPSLVARANPFTMSRFLMRGGSTTRAHLDERSWTSTTRSKLTRQLHASADFRTLVFSQAVVLMEGPSEGAAIPVWLEKDPALNQLVSDLGVAIQSVDGDCGYETYVRYLSQFRIPWAIICDGQAIGDVRQQCRIRDQLERAGWQGIQDISRATGFLERKERLEKAGVFTVANTAKESFEQVPEVQRLLPAARKAVGGHRSKPRDAAYIADNSDCPPSVQAMLQTLLGVYLRQSLDR